MANNTKNHSASVSKKPEELKRQCFPSWTPILLSDGTSKAIGEVVEKRLEVNVLSYDTEINQQKPCRIISWSKIPNRKPLVKVKARFPQKMGGKIKSVTNFVVCTVDHKIWADRQWLEAEKIQAGMIIQVETSATKSQKGKITTEGRKVVAETMRKKNESGCGSKNPNHGGFPIRGGNGRGLSVAEKELIDALPDCFESSFVISTKKRGEGLPNCFKIDVAHPESKVAIEVDGASHGSKCRKEQDARKEVFLHEKGWEVLRFTNREVMQELPRVVQQIEQLVCARGFSFDCPIDAVVESVDPVDIRDFYVYDLEVEECHNFYANGILVRSCANPPL